jgi:hypothetical protein
MVPTLTKLIQGATGVYLDDLAASQPGGCLLASDGWQATLDFVGKLDFAFLSLVLFEFTLAENTDMAQLLN